MKKYIIIGLVLLFLLIPVNIRAEETINDLPYEVTAEAISEEMEPIYDEDSFTVPVLGEINAKTVSLPLLAIVVGAVDGFNPCAMWILIFLITMLLNVESKKKRWILGLAFILTSGIVYLLFMVAWLNFAMFLVNIVWIRLLISIFAIVFGMVNIYRYINSRNKDVGCDVTKEKQRSKIMDRVRKIVGARTFLLALIGIIILSVSVNILELLCSLGLPVIFTQVLALNDLNTAQYALYIGLYIFAFIMNELIIFTIAMTTLSIKGISAKFTKYSHLIGGIIMLLLGLLMIFKPEWVMFNF